MSVLSSQSAAFFLLSGMLGACSQAGDEPLQEPEGMVSTGGIVDTMEPAGSGGLSGTGGETIVTASGGVVGTGGESAESVCADLTPKGSLGLAPVGLPPTAVGQGELKDGGQVIMRFAQSVPGDLPAATVTDPAQQVGLFVAFHEHGGKAGDEVPSVSESLARLGRAGDYVVLGVPMEPGSNAYTRQDYVRVQKLIAYARATWPVNPRRVYVWGRGSGADMGQSFANENQDLIAAAVTYSWGTRSWPTYEPGKHPDHYLVIGLQDWPDSHVPWVRDVFQRATRAGFNLIYREVPGLRGPTLKAPTNDDALTWAITTRHKSLALSPDEQALLESFADPEKLHAFCPDADLLSQLELIGGDEAGQYLPALLGAEAEPTRILAAELAGRAHFGDEAHSALVEQIKDESPLVRAAVLKALGQTANWRHQDSQTALAEFSLDQTAPVEERRLAIESIGHAVRFQIGGGVSTGGYQDPELFRALVTLLSDLNAELRGAAFTILKAARGSNYDPTKAPESQASALQEWEAWWGSLGG